MRKTAALLTFLLVILAFAFPVLAAPGHKAVFVVGQGSYTVDGQDREMDAAPFVESDRTFVPVRYLAYALGIAEKDITWDVKTQTVTITAYDDGWATVVEMQIGVSVLTVIKEPPPGVMTFRYDRTVVQMGVSSLLKGGRVYLPARFVAEALGYEVGWELGSRAVLIGPKGDLPEPPQLLKPPVIHGIKLSPPSREVNGWYEVAGTVVFAADVTGAEHVEFRLSPTGTEAPVVLSRVDNDGRDGWTFTWEVPPEDLTMHLTVVASNSAGTSQEIINLYHEAKR
ncbi:hypothetical protein J2Z49_001930 [Desulfofundulus luciae]|uniref:Copper amine oxidase-like N-terminal domain-containing protein n=1 Tax=Desulfofundulus luciae TaxID=74702 RepID=A0ABU0B259_9FIRM|nr:copper amine oxidase N-terminal domain-containing protein [Desulfofundulus luciae]MDQ0286813.1 hypothetical protein [Desulfofundulus luciae]